MTVNFSKANTFDNFLKKSGTSVLPSSSVLQTPFSVTSKTFEQPSTQEQSTQSTPLGASKVNEHNKKHSKKVFGIIGISVGTAALLTLIALFALSKNFASDFAKKFSKISENIKKTISELSQNSENLTFAQKLKLEFTKKVQPIAENLEAVANITAIKDSLMNKLMRKLKVDRYVGTINKFFKDKIVLTTKNNAYKKAEISVVEFCNYLEKAAKKENNPDLLKQTEKIMSIYAKDFSVKSHVSRTDKNWEQMSGLSEQVFQTLFNPSAVGKEKPKSWLENLKNLKNLKNYVTISMTESQRNLLKSELNHAQDNLILTMKESIEYLQGDKTTADKLVNKAALCLNKAIYNEIKAFNKLAEIQVGSVTTDIMGILMPSFLAAGLIINSENKDKRIGTTLTKGIPIFGGLGVSYYGSTRGFTGAKNLALGLSTGMILNIIGTATNEWYKKYSENQILLKTTFEAFNKLQQKVNLQE